MEALNISMSPLFLLLQFISVALALAYDVPDKYFINCGSVDIATDNNQVFVGEPRASACFSKNSFSDKEDSKSSTTPLLYQSARIFQGPAFYRLKIDEYDGGYHLVRLHFFAFSSPRNLSKAQFNVSCAGFSLLDNFRVNHTSSPLVKEFYLNIQRSRSFQIDFRPVNSEFAFVNAIELIRLPENFIPSVTSRVTSKGSTGDYGGILSSVLYTSYRLEVGGDSAINDSLRRRWDKDNLAINGTSVPQDVPINYYNGKYQGSALSGLASTTYIAPDNIYQTARVMNASLDIHDKSFNVSWELGVKRNTVYFIRAHFCDTISMAEGLTTFNLYIYDHFNWSVRLDYWSSAVPFYSDFVVKSDDSGKLRISVGPDRDSIVKNAFLNGLEVMEVINPTGLQAVAGESDCNKKSFYLLALELGLPALAVICIISVGLCLILKHRKPMSAEGGGSSHGKWGSSHGSSLGNLKLGLKIPFHEIQSATKNFQAKRIIGKGGFGNVYKGILKNGMKVAVKRSEPGSGQGFPEFQTEIMVLSRIRHRHLVSLIGYCDERSEMILVYEYMEKGTLRDHLFNSNLPILTWKQRLEICIGAARGLNYLHKGAAGGIIHRDVKSTNILLDENHVAKVADFGLSRTGPLDQQPSVTTGVKGTFGYLDPEYFRTQQLTEKSDVYSFGVVLLEVLCARPALDPSLPWEQVNLAEWGMYCKRRGTLEQIIDPRIKDQIDANSLRKFSETVEKCLQEDGSDRPTMGDVLWDLEYSLQLQRGAGQRKSQEDASSRASASLELTHVRRIPSLSTPGDSEAMSILKDDSAVDSAVFSQMNVHSAR